MLIVILNVALLVILVMGTGYIAERKLARAGKTIFLSVGVVLTVIRVGSLWFLQFREWTNTQSISYLPLVFLLFPEAFFEQYLVSQVPAPARSVWDVFHARLVARQFVRAADAQRWALPVAESNFFL